MQISPSLRAAIEQLLHGKSLTTMVEGSKQLSERYTETERDDYVTTLNHAITYVAMRMPSTYSVLLRIFSEVAERVPSFEPKSMIDFGAGPGTALWAVSEVWKSIKTATLLDCNGNFRDVGQQLAAKDQTRRFGSNIEWKDIDFRSAATTTKRSAVVVASYLLSELPAVVQLHIVRQMWNAAEEFLVIIEPGTPRGFNNIIAARTELLAQGAHIFAPCAAALTCPLHAESPKRWCHFAERVERPSFQRISKAASLAYEDEKYSYLVVSRNQYPHSTPRVINTPIVLKYQASLDLCTSAGQIEKITIPKTDKQAFRRAKKLGWGDRFSSE